MDKQIAKARQAAANSAKDTIASISSICSLPVYRPFEINEEATTKAALRYFKPPQALPSVPEIDEARDVAPGEVRAMLRTFVASTMKNKSGEATRDSFRSMDEKVSH